MLIFVLLVLPARIIGAQSVRQPDRPEPGLIR